MATTEAIFDELIERLTLEDIHAHTKHQWDALDAFAAAERKVRWAWKDYQKAVAALSENGLKPYYAEAEK